MSFQNLKRKITELGLEEEYLDLFGKLKFPTKHVLSLQYNIYSL